jgi:hypothetical protein
MTFAFMRRNPAFRERTDAALLRLPLLGRLARGYNAARFGGTLAMLAGAGVPILKALQAAAETLANHAMRADALDALVQVREGAPLASALAAKKRFPALLSMFARLGEQTGQLPLMLGRASTQMAAEVQRRALAVATILEPLLIVVMGVVVLVIVLAVLLPIIQLNTLRSAEWFGTQDKNGFMYRSWMKNQGIPTTSSRASPSSASATPGRELTPCNAHFRKLAEHVKRASWRPAAFRSSSRCSPTASPICARRRC